MVSARGPEHGVADPGPPQCGFPKVRLLRGGDRAPGDRRSAWHLGHRPDRRDTSTHQRHELMVRLPSSVGSASNRRHPYEPVLGSSIVRPGCDLAEWRPRVLIGRKRGSFASLLSVEAVFRLLLRGLSSFRLEKTAKNFALLDHLQIFAEFLHGLRPKRSR